MGDETRLAELVEAFGISLRSCAGKLAGVCPRCGGDLVVDAERWSCGCGSGGPVELVACFGGFSMSHAAELVRSGWLPEGPSSSITKSSIRPLPLLCDPDSDDEAVIDAVLAHYQGERRTSEEVQHWLAERGLDDGLSDELRIGFANRTLDYRLPEANRRDGAKLRDQLMHLGLYRSSGHEHFRGCVVVPVLSSESRVLALCGIRVSQTSTECQWAAGLPGGMFNERAATTNEDLLLVASIEDALTIWGTGHHAVVAPGRSGGFQRSDLRLLARGGVRRCTIIGDGLASLAERVAAEGIDCTLISPGAPLATLLRRAGDRAAALKALLATAIPGCASDDTTACDVAHARSAVLDAQPVPTGDGTAVVSGDAAELHVAFGTRRWRARGADRNKTPNTLRVALTVTDTEHGGFHLDTLDLCQAKARATFVEAAVAELHAERAGLVRELATCP